MGPANTLASSSGLQDREGLRFCYPVWSQPPGGGNSLLAATENERAREAGPARMFAGTRRGGDAPVLGVTGPGGAMLGAAARAQPGFR